MAPILSQSWPPSSTTSDTSPASSLHTLCRRGVTVAYRQGLDHIDSKHQGLWTCDAFCQYIISS